MSAAPDDCVHLSVADVREIHESVIAEFGGLSGIRDMALLESAVAAPQATMFGESPFTDVVEVAAAYLFYLCRNHPFVDGNKRVGMLAAIVFLRLNGIDTREDGPEWESFVFDVASSRLDREAATVRLRTLIL